LELSNQILDQRLIAESTNVLGRAYRKLGETFRAEFLLRQAVTEAEKSGQKYIAATYNISLGKVYCQVGSYTEALESLGIAEKQLNELHSLRELAEVKLYQAAAFYRCGKIKETLACLSHTQKLCPKDGFDGFLLADSGELLDVLNFGMAKRVGWNGLASLVARISAGQRPRDLVPTSPGQSGPPLGLLGLRVHSLGESKIWLDSHEVSDGEWRTKKAKELFYFLLARKNLASKEEIVESLWPNKSLEFRTSKLKTTVYRLRQALFFDCIQADDSGYRINPEISVEFDLDEFRKCLKSAGSAAAGPEARQQHLSKAVELHAGPFLNGYDSEWCDELRFDVGAKYQAALMNLAAYQTAGGNFQRAIELLEKIIATDPWDEEAQYQCIQNYINCEDPFQALQQLRKFDRLSAVELGCDLPPRFTECRRRIQLLMPSPA
jgi:DNA-binding SARP family transcriptional activator